MQSKQPEQKQMQPKKQSYRFLDYTKENMVEPNDSNYALWLHGYGCGMFKYKIKLLQWANERKRAETDLRPDKNIHKRTLIETWNQIIHKLKGR